jgi:hypothetical protein
MLCCSNHSACEQYHIRKHYKACFSLGTVICDHGKLSGKYNYYRDEVADDHNMAQAAKHKRPHLVEMDEFLQDWFGHISAGKFTRSIQVPQLKGCCMFSHCEYVITKACSKHEQSQSTAPVQQILDSLDSEAVALMKGFFEKVSVGGVIRINGCSDGYELYIGPVTRNPAQYSQQATFEDTYAQRHVRLAA